jgi:hypothetical protein
LSSSLSSDGTPRRLHWNAQVPLPDQPGPVTGPLEDLGQRQEIRAQTDELVGRGDDIGHLRTQAVHAGHERRARGRTRRRRHESIHAMRPLTVEPVHVRRVDVRIPVRPHGPTRLIVRPDEHNARTPIPGRRRPLRTKQPRKPRTCISRTQESNRKKRHPSECAHHKVTPSPSRPSGPPFMALFLAPSFLVLCSIS